MSSVYATEPATTGRVVFDTTHGPLELQLWCRECPLTTKLFLQLCIDDFFTGMIFHRIVPNLFLQTGALRQQQQQQQQQQPVGFTQEYRERIAAQEQFDRRKYEVHSRLKFNHRGQVAMALAIQDDNDDKNHNKSINDSLQEQLQLQPQFFITLDEAPYLDGKHVLFGTIVGPTIFNALRIGSLECNSEHQPLDFDYAPRITGTKIVEQPTFMEVKPSATVPWKETPQTKSTAQKKKRKGRKDLNVLSFGNELQEYDNKCVGIQSSHDVLLKKSLIHKGVDQEADHHTAAATAPSKVKPVVSNKKSPQQQTKVPIFVQDNNQPNKTLTVQHELSPLVTATTITTPPMQGPNQLPAPTSVVEDRLLKYQRGNKRKNKEQGEKDTMAKLMAFQSKVRTTVSMKKTNASAQNDDGLAARMARSLEENVVVPSDKPVESYHGQVLETDNDPVNWLGTSFTCKRHVDHASREGLGGDGRSMDEYLVIDPKTARGNRGKGQANRRR